jgi:IS5 family transposase
VWKNTTYRTLLDERIEMPRIRSATDLKELPFPSTSCKTFNRLDMAVWSILVDLLVTLLPTNRTVVEFSG